MTNPGCRAARANEPALGLRRARFWLGLCCCALLAYPAGGLASEAQLKDGRNLKGNINKVSRTAENPNSPRETDVIKTIMLVDNGLKRVFVPQIQLRLVSEDTGEVVEKIAVKQNVAEAGGRIARLGPYLNVTPWDEHGRRTVTIMTDRGAQPVLQGITLITPVYTKVEGLKTEKKPHLVWDMRIATNSIPIDQLKQILKAQNAKLLDQRLRVVRLFLQMDLFQEAKKELEDIIVDFPKQAKDLNKEVESLNKLHAQRIVDEIKVRKRAGQHLLACSLLAQFPHDAAPGTVLEQVRELTDEYQEAYRRLALMEKELTALVAGLEDTQRRKQSEDMLEEMRAELNINTIDRLASYWLARGDDNLGPEQKISLAFSGWMMGTNESETNLGMTLAQIKVRSLIEAYLNEPVKLNRTPIFNQLKAIEGASVTTAARLIKNMKPPLVTPAPSRAQPLLYDLTVPIGIQGEADANYRLLLPPSYDPHVKYPTIVVLNGQINTPEKELEWWAGAEDPNGNRLGQATRFGYIVLAVDWMKPGQQEYEFSAREHATVLASLRDACRRFSINTDRVFLAGHSLGANAAFDIGLSHPDLWAGVIPIVGVAEKFCYRYWQNAKLVPFYVLAGELDGDKTIRNSDTIDRLMTGRFDVTLTEYMGRGHENFYEDIGNIFDWMNRRESRNFFPKEFTISTLRTWDNFFWWVEAGELPENAMVDPVRWDEFKGVRAVEIIGKVLPPAGNGLTINASNIQPTIWLSPEVVDFAKPIQIKVGGTQMVKGNKRIEPQMSVLLEDVLTRGDRQHPFWAKVQ